MKKLKGIKSIHIGKKGRIAGAVVLTLVVCAAAVMQVKPDLVATQTGNQRMKSRPKKTKLKV